MFRQRAGHLDWKRLTSVSVDRLVRNAEGDAIHELNSIIDNITFSTFTERDAEGNSCLAIAQLVQLMQLSLEHLLCFQETQSKALVELATKGKSLKKKNLEMRREIESLKEDVVIYQRQLALIKKNNNNDFLSSNQPPSYRYVLGQPDNFGDKSSSSLIQTFLKHEDSTREFMKGMLEEQREVFLQKMEMMSKNVVPAAATPSAAGAVRGSIESLGNERMNILEETKALYQRQLALKEKEWQFDLRENEMKAMLEREQRKLREREEEMDNRLRRKEKELEEKHQESLRQLQFNAIQSQEEPQNRSVDLRDRLGATNESHNFVEAIRHSNLVLRVKLFAASTLLKIAERKWNKTLRRHFSWWRRSLDAIKSAGTILSQQELMTELVKAKNANADLLLKLKELQQKALIENARTNALQRKAEEKAKQAAPSSLARFADSSVNTSLEVIREIVPPAGVADKSHNKFLRGARSDKELMDRIEVDVRRTVGELDSLVVKRNLAEEIMRRMDHE